MERRHWHTVTSPASEDLLNVVKNESKLYLLGGVVDNELMTRKTIEAYSKLPNKEIMYSQLLTTLTMQQMNLTKLLIDGGAGRVYTKLNTLIKERSNND